MNDPRVYQIAALSALLIYGIGVLEFDVTAGRALVIVGTAIAAQAVCSRLARIKFDPKSAAISGLSLAILLRSNSITLLMIAAVIAIASKFLIRLRGKHVFNPTNFAIVALLAVADRVWVSPGQWGNVAFFGFLIACLGIIVVSRARRSDVTFAFLAAWALILIGRSLRLGEPLSIPMHRFENGALLLFSFFMISDPKTTPDSRAGRILFAFLVATGAWFVQFRLFRNNGLLWSLAAWSAVVPLIDRLIPAERYVWQPLPNAGGRPMHRIAAALTIVVLSATVPAHAFCGFYVAKGDAKLFNHASQVVIVRDGDRTVMTMANDFQGDPREFAVVIPVPAVPQRGQIHVAEKALIDHLDAYSAPRLVEYYDGDPCRIVMYRADAAAKSAVAGAVREEARARSRGVTIEARYTVGEYDILILSAKQSDGLETWLVENGYTIPRGAAVIFGSYIRQGMKFFVAKVNLEEQSKLGFTYLRPLQIAYESPKFMLPIRLGTVNAKGSQELFFYTLTRNGRVETTNYRTVRLPSDAEIPLYVRERFGDFYKALFSRQVENEDMNTVFLEYAWDMAWCDPCAADPLSREELRNLGVFWSGDDRSQQNVFITRLHIRYDRPHFPEDLVFQQTGDRGNFQARYVLHYSWRGDIECEAAREYRHSLRQRQEQEASNLARLTGWDINMIRRKMNLASTEPAKNKSWWEELWNCDTVTLCHPELGKGALRR